MNSRPRRAATMPTSRSSGVPPMSDTADGVPPGAPVRTLDSQSLLQGQSVVQIEHRGEIYRLQATRLGKLILTK